MAVLSGAPFADSSRRALTAPGSLAAADRQPATLSFNETHVIDMQHFSRWTLGMSNNGDYSRIVTFTGEYSAMTVWPCTDTLPSGDRSFSVMIPSAIVKRFILTGTSRSRRTSVPLR